MAFSMDGRISLSAAGRLCGSTGLAGRKGRLAKLGNRELMGKQLKVNQRSRCTDSKMVRPSVCMSLTINVANEGKGAPPCTFYTQHGMCKFGPTCKFDHPMPTLSYNSSASSLADMPVAPYPVGSSLATLAPSSSSSELRPEFVAGSHTDAFSTRIPSSDNTSSGSVGSIFSKGGSVPQSLVQHSSQSSGPSSI